MSMLRVYQTRQALATIKSNPNMVHPLFTVALPTYRRPELLGRALRSLLGQTNGNWTAVVFDDSPDGEGEDVVCEIGDRRITYRRNASPLGAAMNIDGCFGERLGNIGGYACILEDDNSFEPGYLDHVAHVMTFTEADVALFNQRIRKSEHLLPAGETTRGSWFAEGWITPHDLHSSLLLMEGVSNGGIVWRPQAKVRLAVGPTIKLTALHEACRSLLLRKPIYYSSNALAVWTHLPTELTARRSERNRVVGRGYQSITDWVLQAYGDSAVDLAIRYAANAGRTSQLVSRLLHAGYLKKAFRVDRGIAFQNLGSVFKGFALRCSFADPCRQFLNELKLQHSNS